MVTCLAPKTRPPLWHRRKLSLRLSGSDTFIRCVSSPLQCWHWFRALGRTPAYFHLKSQHTLLSDIVLSIDLSQSCTHPTFYLRDSFKFRLCADLRLLGQYIIFRVPTSPSSLYTKKSIFFTYLYILHSFIDSPWGSNRRELIRLPRWMAPRDQTRGPDSRGWRYLIGQNGQSRSSHSRLWRTAASSSGLTLNTKARLAPPLLQHKFHKPPLQ